VAAALLIAACGAEPARTGDGVHDTIGTHAAITPPLPVLLESVPAVPGMAATPALRHSQAAYEARCATCHGLYGHGDGPRARAFARRLPDIGRLATSPEVGQLVARMQAERDSAGSGAAAPVWHAMPPETLRLAAAYVTMMSYRGSPGNPAAGRLLYATYCVQCHGIRGAGDGRLATDFIPRPTDLRALRDAAQEPRVLASIREGGSRDHRPYMPDWGSVMTDAQLQDVVSYLAVLHAVRQP
jgi:mono/diheme cytochrome c family protein